MASSKFGFKDFGIRLLFALVLVFAAYNPFGYSFFHWVKENLDALTPWMALAGIILIIGWTMYIRATLRSLGPFGLLLAFAFFGVLLWIVVDLGLVSAENVKTLATLVEILFACVLATGMSWSHIRRRMSGQLDVDDVEE